MREKKLRILSVKGIFLVSEGILPQWIDIINEAFPNVPVLLHYGLSERTNFAWGGLQNGQIEYRLVPAYSFSENLYDENGYPEIVGTSYWNDVMPLIRYRTQDFGMIENGIIKKLDGRSQDYLVARDGLKMSGMSISIDKFTWDFVENFQIVQNEVGKIEFHLVPRSNFNSEIEKKILEAQHQKWGGFFDMRIVIRSKIERTKGAKQRLVINNIG